MVIEKYCKTQRIWATELNSFPASVAYMRQWIESALVQIMACRQAIIQTNAGLFLLESLGTDVSEILIKNIKFFFHENVWRHHELHKHLVTWLEGHRPM